MTPRTRDTPVHGVQCVKYITPRKVWRPNWGCKEHHATTRGNLVTHGRDSTPNGVCACKLGPKRARHLPYTSPPSSQRALPSAQTPPPFPPPPATPFLSPSQLPLPPVHDFSTTRSDYRFPTHQASPQCFPAHSSSPSYGRPSHSPSCRP